MPRSGSFIFGIKSKSQGLNFFFFFSCWACFSVQLSIYKTRFTRILLHNLEPVFYSRSLKLWNSVSLKQVLGVLPMFSPHASPFVVSIGGRDSLFGIPNRYGLDGPLFEPRRGRNFPYPSTQALYSGYGISFPGLSGGERVKQPPSLSSMSGPSWRIIVRSYLLSSALYQPLASLSSQVVWLQWRPFSYFFICSPTCRPVAWIVFSLLQFSSVITL